MQPENWILGRIRQAFAGIAGLPSPTYSTPDAAIPVESAVVQQSAGTQDSSGESSLAMSPRQALCMGHAKAVLAASRKAAAATVDACAPDDDGWFRLNDNLSLVPVHDDKVAFGAVGHYNQSVGVVLK